MNAIGMYIFSGSQTIGHILEGWEVDKVLEMTEDMDQTNAYHFVRNYSIPIIKPSEWKNEEYLSKLVNKYDLLFANPPCSGLSSINRNAKVENDINKHIYEVADVISIIKPKTFLIENAPTLIRLGLPILKDIQQKLKDDYRICIISDLAGNHNVPMHRRRTLVVGFSRSEFKKLPIVESDKHKIFTVGDSFRGLSYLADNMTYVSINDHYNFSRFYSLVKPDETVVKALCYADDSIKSKLTEEELDLVNRSKVKYDKGGSVWDKSPLRLNLNSRAPSITSVNRYIHPLYNRDLYIREYARLMGYPDDYKFFSGGKVSEIQCIAQGVPVNFIRYISSQIKKSFDGCLPCIDCDVAFIDQAQFVKDNNLFDIDQRRVKFFNSEEFQVIKTLAS